MSKAVEESSEEEVRIGVVGVGYVGGAIYSFFDSQGLSVKAFDKYKEKIYLDDDGAGFVENSSLEDLLDSDYIYVCLPTPYIETFGFDYSEVHATLRFLSENKYGGIIFLKSTVEPGTTKSLALKYGLPNLIHNPEFLTARTAAEDFKNQKHIVIGGFSMGPCQKAASFYSKYFEANITICDAEQAECMKLFCNNFYAVKVQLMTEFYLLCQRMGVNYDDVKVMMIKNGWLSDNHLNIPGPDGSVSYGGACFPKDTKALSSYMERVGSPNGIIKACIEERDKMRKD